MANPLLSSNFKQLRTKSETAVTQIKQKIKKLEGLKGAIGTERDGRKLRGEINSALSEIKTAINTALVKLKEYKQCKVDPNSKNDHEYSYM